MSNISSFFKTLFASKNESVLGIDIGTSAIKVVELYKRKGRAVLQNYGVLALGPYGKVGVGRATNLTSEKYAEAVTDILRELKMSGKSAGLSIPFKSSLVSTIEVPNVPYTELQTMVPIEARKYIPVPISEVTIDWSVVPKDEFAFDKDEEMSSGMNPTKETQENIDKNKLEVLVVAIHNDTITKWNEIVSKAGVSASFFEVEIFSTMRSVMDNELQPVMIVDMGASSTKFYIIERGIIKSSYTVPRGSQDISLAISQSIGVSYDEAEIIKREVGLKDVNSPGASSASITTNYIFGEANRLILDYEKKYGKSLSKVILVGGGSSLKGLNALAHSAFETEVVTANPFLKVYSTAFSDDVLTASGPEFSVAVGLALRKLQELP